MGRVFGGRVSRCRSRTRHGNSHPWVDAALIANGPFTWLNFVALAPGPMNRFSGDRGCGTRLPFTIFAHSGAGFRLPVA